MDSLREAEALDNKAQLYETSIEKIASRQGNPDLVTRLKEARVNLAKNYDVERALNVGSGDVDAQVIGRMLDRGKLMSGGLETIGRFANAFGRFAREGVQSPGVSKLEAYGSLGLGAAGHFAFPGGEMAAAIPLLAPPLARSLMLSSPMQGGMSGLSSLLPEAGRTVAPIVTGNTLSDIQRQQRK